MKRYCTSCGGPTEYSIKKPIFCSNCGGSFEPITQKAVEKIQIKKPIVANKINIQDFDEADDIINNNDDIRTVPSISNIEIEADNEKPNMGIKLKDLMGTEANHTKRERVKSKSKKSSKKQVLEDFAKEAGFLRKSKK